MYCWFISRQYLRRYLFTLSASAYAGISTIGSIRYSVVCLRIFLCTWIACFYRIILLSVCIECGECDRAPFFHTVAVRFVLCADDTAKNGAEYTLLLSNKNTNRDEHKTVINDYVVRCAIRFMSAQICRFNKNQIRVNRICSMFSILVSAPVNGCVVLKRRKMVYIYMYIGALGKCRRTSSAAPCRYFRCK